MRRSVQLALACLLLGSVSFAADLAQLRNGFTIRHERREVIGEITRLHTKSGFVDIATADIIGFERDDTPEAVAEKPAPPAKTIEQHVSDASASSGIDPDFLSSVIRQESGFNAKAVSPKGARGLMQLMPKTAEQLGVKDAFDPAQNIQGGTTYLRELLVKYNGDAQKALAAYNAGPNRVEQYKGVPPYRETRAYVASIIRDYNRKKAAAQKATTATRGKSSPSSTPAKTKSRRTSASAHTTQTPRG